MTAPPPYLKVWMTAPTLSQGLDDPSPYLKVWMTAPPLSQGLDDRPSPPYLKVWMTAPPLSQGLDPPLLLPNVFTEENGLMSLQIISKLFISVIKLA